MNQKDFKLLIFNISNLLKPINQLLYQSIILIIFYYIFNSISFIELTDKNNNNQNNHKKFIYLIFIICIILDWFIWNNCIQTFLFTSILYLYILYNFNTNNKISTFINVINNSRDINNNNTQYEIDLYNNKLDQDIKNKTEQDKLNMITFVPKDIIINYIPEPYQKNLEGNNEINSAFSSSIPSISITDSKFADAQLISLYDTPQYKSLDTSFADTSSDTVNLFKNPKKEFLDNKWLYLKENTYNDNCKSCKQINTNTKNNTKNNKNAICTVVKYGQELEECTNQSNKVNYMQLENISTNKVIPIYNM